MSSSDRELKLALKLESFKRRARYLISISLFNTAAASFISALLLFFREDVLSKVFSGYWAVVACLSIHTVFKLNKS